MNKHSKENIHLKTFRGATCKDMLIYVQPALDRAKSDGIIIHVGRKSPRLQAKINEVYDVLRDLCTIDGFVFIDNTNLSDCDVCEDLLHLSYSGTCKLANNFIGAINRNLEKSSF